MKRIIIIGGDSSIAQSFINYYQSKYFFIVFSRKPTNYKNEIVLDDFFNISFNNCKGFDAVINFAAIVHNPSNADNDIYFKINSELPFFLYNLANEYGIDLFVQISTISVYGFQELISIDSLEAPTNVYSQSKLHGDNTIINNLRSTKICILRPPMVYGSTSSPGNMAKLISLINTFYILPFNGIKNKRHFIHVKNLIQYISIVIDKKIYGKYIVSDSKFISTEELVYMIKNKLGKKRYIVVLPRFILIFIKYFFKNFYNKIFNSSIIISNFPAMYIIEEYSIDNGISEMVEAYKNKII